MSAIRVTTICSIGWIVTINGIQHNVEDSVAAKASRPRLTFSPSEDFLICTFDDSTQIVSPTYLLDSTLAHVPNRGFYKDIFMDAGAYLTTHRSLSAVSHLGYTMEYVNCPRKGVSEVDTAWQNSVIGGGEEDENGRLLYPDGAPRYRMIYVCGGDSRGHGCSMRASCLENMRAFVLNGGSYVGTCAGAFFATSQRDMYLHLWPGVAKQTGLSQSKTGMFVEEESPLLRYYDFGGDNYVADIRHNGGCYALDWPQGTELLARFDYPQSESMHLQPSAWAYKNNKASGRVIMEGSHPEEVGSGERRDFTAAMLRYAADGVGVTRAKGFLNNGEPWIMDKSSADADPLHTKIGDLQYHHFAVVIPEGAEDIVVSLTSPTDCDLQLSLCSSTYAYSDVADYITDVPGANQQLILPDHSAGLWYIAVRCLTTVTSTDVPLGQEYSGRTDVLNGVPYTISVNWNHSEL